MIIKIAKSMKVKSRSFQNVQNKKPPLRNGFLRVKIKKSKIFVSAASRSITPPPPAVGTRNAILLYIILHHTRERDFAEETDNNILCKQMINNGLAAAAHAQSTIRAKLFKVSAALLR